MAPTEHAGPDPLSARSGGVTARRACLSLRRGATSVGAIKSDDEVTDEVTIVSMAEHRLTASSWSRFLSGGPPPPRWLEWFCGAVWLAGVGLVISRGPVGVGIAFALMSLGLYLGQRQARQNFWLGSRTVKPRWSRWSAALIAVSASPLVLGLTGGEASRRDSSAATAARLAVDPSDLAAQSGLRLTFVRESLAFSHGGQFVSAHALNSPTEPIRYGNGVGAPSPDSAGAVNVALGDDNGVVCLTTRSITGRVFVLASVGTTEHYSRASLRHCDTPAVETLPLEPWR